MLDLVVPCTETAGGAGTLVFELMLEDLVRVYAAADGPGKADAHGQLGQDGRQGHSEEVRVSECQQQAPTRLAAVCPVMTLPKANLG